MALSDDNGVSPLRKAWPTETQKAVGRALRRRAAQRGWSMREVALQAEVSHPAVIRLFAGSGAVTLRVIERVCSALEITVGGALEDGTEPPWRGR